MASMQRRLRKEQAIAALLHGRTVKEAAASIGMSYGSLTSWLSSEWFTKEYDAAKLQLLDSTINQLRTAGGEGVATLRDVAGNQNNPAAARATAGRALVELLLRAIETQDLAARLERLEDAMSANKEGK